MPRIVGTNVYVSFAATVLTADFKTFDWEEEQKLADATAGADTNATKLSIYKDGKASLTALNTAGGTAFWAAVANGASGTLIFADEGTATGKPKHTVLAVVAKRSKKNPFDNVEEIMVDFEFLGAVTDATY